MLHHRQRRVALFGGSALLAAGSLGLMPGAGVAAQRPIIFSGSADGIAYSGQIWAMKADGTDHVDLTHESGNHVTPSWSPGGKRFAYARAGDIWWMNADGGTKIKVTTSGGNINPDWSPDGQRILYSKLPPGGGTSKLYTVGIIGGPEVYLGLHGSSPDWSTNGKKIVYVVTACEFVTCGPQHGNTDIFVANSDGTGEVNITKNHAKTSPPDRNILPKWSPDGKRIAFSANRDGNFEIYVMNANGTQPARLTNDPADDFSPSWSPDGDYIVFDSARVQYPKGLGYPTKPVDTFRMRPDGGELVNLSTKGAPGKSAGAARQPAWRPEQRCTPALCDKPNILSSLDMGVEVFKAASSGGSISRARLPVGTAVRYTLGTPAVSRFRAQRVRRGVRRRGACVPAARRSIRRRKRCTAFKRARGSFAHRGHAGQNSFHFTGRVGGRKLPPGRYRLLARPISATGIHGRATATRFRIVR